MKTRAKQLPDYEKHCTAADHHDSLERMAIEAGLDTAATMHREAVEAHQYVIHHLDHAGLDYSDPALIAALRGLSATAWRSGRLADAHADFDFLDYAIDATVPASLAG